jgi:hypothetical protein
MKNFGVVLIFLLVVLMVVVFFLVASKSAGPVALSSAASSLKSPDALELKLQNYSGPAATVIVTSWGAVNPNRMLHSISISPSSATAQNGHARFVATGTFSASPVTVTPLLVNWNGPALPMTLRPVVCAPNACPGIDSLGLATCGQTWTGTFTITASAPRDPKVALETRNVRMVTATATLTCP